MTTVRGFVRHLVFAALVAGMLLSPVAGQAASGYAGVGYRAYARFGHCFGAPAGSVTYKVYMYLRPTVDLAPGASIGHYRLATETMSGGVCVTKTIDTRPSTNASVFTVSPDMSSAQLDGPSKLGHIHLVWTASNAPAPGTDRTVTTTSPLVLESGTFLERPQSATGTIGSVVVDQTITRSPSIKLGAWESISG